MTSAKKLKLLYLREYLLKNADENHVVRTSEIQKYLQDEHEISADRKTIYDDLEVLKSYGMEIRYDNDKQGYRVIHTNLKQKHPKSNSSRQEI